MTIKALSLMAMAYAIYGSWLFVDSKSAKADFVSGSKAFMVGNAINTAIGLAIGDLALVLSQAMLAYYTIPMYEDRRYNAFIVAATTILVAVLGVAPAFSFSASWLGLVATILAVYGAYRMSVADYTTMAWMWILADLAFIYIAVIDGLPGLFLQSVLFVWHGYLRVTNRQRHGLLH